MACALIRKKVAIAEFGAEAFGACEALARGGLPCGLTTVPPLAFFGCAGLTDVALPPGVTKIGEGAFLGCRSLRSVTAGRLRVVGENAFSDCVSLRSVSATALPRVGTIGNEAFFTAAAQKNPRGG